MGSRAGLRTFPEDLPAFLPSLLGTHTRPGAHATNLHTTPAFALLSISPFTQSWSLAPSLSSVPTLTSHWASPCATGPERVLPSLPHTTSTATCWAPCIYVACLWAISHISVFVFLSRVINIKKKCVDHSWSERPIRFPIIKTGSMSFPFSVDSFLIWYLGCLCHMVMKIQFPFLLHFLKYRNSFLSCPLSPSRWLPSCPHQGLLPKQESTATLTYFQRAVLRQHLGCYAYSKTISNCHSQAKKKKKSLFEYLFLWLALF